MRLKSLIKNWVPPGALLAARRALAYVRRPSWEYMPDGWQTRDARIRGWNDESIVEVHKRQWPDFVRSLQGPAPLGTTRGDAPAAEPDYEIHNTLLCFAYVLALTAGDRTHVSLLDWGGGTGRYYVVSKALFPHLSIEYHCKDLPVFCRAGREMLPEATFYDSDAECFRRKYHLVLASGSLLYAEEWRSVLRQMAQSTSKYLFVTRLPIVHRAASFVVVQRPYSVGYRTEYLGWFLNRRELLDGAADAGLTLVREFLIHERPLVHKAPEQAEYRGFLFRPNGDSAPEQGATL